MTTLDPSGLPSDFADEPRSLGSTKSKADWTFLLGSGGVGTVVLAITTLIGIFLGAQLVETIHRFGFSFFTQHQWTPATSTYGLAQVLIGTVEVALIALSISFPLALLVSLYVSEYAPRQIRGGLVAAIDLMAAVPSVIYGLWGYFMIMPKALYISVWINTYFGWIPFLHVDANPHAATLQATLFDQSPFLAGLIVSMMVIPMGAAVMLGVFRQAPLGEREAAYALGSTRWGMIRSVVLPFGRGGIIGGTMLSLGRALGETVAVYLILSFNTGLKFKPLQIGGVTTASLIANNFPDASNVQLSALLAAGFVLFLITLVVNTLAAVIVNRSRSGAATDI